MVLQVLALVLVAAEKRTFGVNEMRGEPWNERGRGEMVIGEEEHVEDKGESMRAHEE